MFKKTLCILSLLSSQSLFCMDREISHIVTLANIGKNKEKSFEERLKALEEASRTAQALKKQTLSDSEYAALSRTLGREVKGCLPIIVFGQTISALIQLRRDITLTQMETALEIPTDAITTPVQAGTSHFDSMQSNVHKLGTQRDEEHEARCNLEDRIRLLEEQLRQTQEVVQKKEQEIENCSEVIEELNSESDKTLLSLAEKTTDVYKLRNTLQQVIKNKRQLEQEIASYKQDEAKLAQIINQLQISKK